MAIPKYDATGNPITNIPPQSVVKGKIVGTTPATPDYSMYRTDIAGRDAAIKEQGTIYNTQKAVGHMDLANQAHTTANAIRDASGLAGTYNTVTGAPLQTNIPPQSVMQPQQNIPQQSLYQDPYARSSQDIATLARDRINERLGAGRTSAQGALTGAKNAYDYTNQIEGDNRNLRNFAFKNHNDPFSGETGYQASQMLRNDSIADTAQDNEYNAQVAQINQKLTDLEAAAPGQEQQIIDELQQIERTTGINVAQLQEQQKQNQFNQGIDVANQTGYYNGQRNIQGQQLDTNKSLAEAGLTGSYNGQQTLAGKNQSLNETQVMAQLTGFMSDGKGGFMPTNQKQQQDLQNEWVASEQTGVISDNLAKMYGLPKGSPTQAAKEFTKQLAISQQNANTSATSATNAANNASFNQKMDIWKATGKAPAGIQGVPIDTPFSDANQASTEFNQGMEVFKATGQAPDYLSKYGVDVKGLNDTAVKQDLVAMYDAISAGTDPTSLIKVIDDKVRLGIEKKEDGDKLKNAIYIIRPDLDPNKPKGEPFKLPSFATGVKELGSPIPFAKQFGDWWTGVSKKVFQGG